MGSGYFLAAHSMICSDTRYWGDNTITVQFLEIAMFYGTELSIFIQGFLTLTAFHIKIESTVFLILGFYLWHPRIAILGSGYFLAAHSYMI